MVSCVVGIDPGLRGGIAILTLDAMTRTVHHVELLPLRQMTTRDTWKVFAEITCYTSIRAYIERISTAIPFIGKSAMSKLYGSYTKLEGFLVASGIRFSAVWSKDWQRGLGISKRKNSESDSQWKKRLRNQAENLFPDQPDITTDTADALLIAEWGRRQDDKVSGT